VNVMVVADGKPARRGLMNAYDVPAPKSRTLL
jgi:hypothetical protein